jgi:hypothetical protein
LNGKRPSVDPVDPASAWPPSERRRTTERHRARRRARRPNDIRARIRLRIWIACTGALLAMVVALYLALGRGEHPSESGQRPRGASSTVAAVVANAPVRG